MSRELWAVEPGKHGNTLGASHYGDGWHCRGGTPVSRVDFDAIWDRFYETANRRFEAGLTYNELKQVVLGGTE